MKMEYIALNAVFVVRRLLVLKLFCSISMRLQRCIYFFPRLSKDPDFKESRKYNWVKTEQLCSKSRNRNVQSASKSHTFLNQFFVEKIFTKKLHDQKMQDPLPCTKSVRQLNLSNSNNCAVCILVLSRQSYLKYLRLNTSLFNSEHEMFLQLGQSNRTVSKSEISHH